MKKFNRAVCFFAVVVLVLAMMTTTAFAEEGTDSSAGGEVISGLVQCEIVPNDSAFEIPDDATIHQMVVSSLLRGSSIPTASYDLGWEGPYYYTGTASANVYTYTNYLLYGISSANYYLRVTNNGSSTCTNNVIWEGFSLGTLYVNPGSTMTMQFSAPSSISKFYVKSSSGAALNVSGCVYY